MTRTNAATRVTPMITGRSCCRIAVTDSQPSPRRLKTVSVRTVPPSSWPRSRPKMVTIGVSAARRPCLHDDAAPRQALGASGADVVLAHRLEHVRAGKPGVEGREEERQRDPGQDHALEPLRRIAGDGRVRGVSHPFQPVLEDQQQQRAGEEDRQRHAGERRRHAGAVEDRSGVQAGQGADEHATDQPQDRGADSQAQGHRKCLPYQRADGRVLLERVAEARRVAVHVVVPSVSSLAEEDAVQPVPVLLVPRQVEAELVLEQLELQRARRERDLADVVVDRRACATGAARAGRSRTS